VAYPYPGIAQGVLAMPIGLGHTSFGRYARSETGNPVQLASGQLDPAGGLLLSLASVAIEKAGRIVPVANTDGSGYQHGRNLARRISWQEYRPTVDQPSEVVPPLPEGFKKERDFYPSHEHTDYRWIMVVDLDRCIGCQACVVACYAENNVGIVGKENVLKGRVMSWLHVERYLKRVSLLSAFYPCSASTATRRPASRFARSLRRVTTKMGSTTRCIIAASEADTATRTVRGKVRRSNWFTWKHDAPLEWQLNPDVTVRTKGVMEKCSFCIQRIVAAKITARNEGRLVRDGEFTTACAQTCPTDALVFGNLKDPASRVCN